jgi:hypothetical protein
MPPKALYNDELEKTFLHNPNLEGHIVPPIFKQDTVVLRVQYHEPIDINPTILGEFSEHFNSMENSPSLEINNGDDRGPQIEIKVSVETYRSSQ